MFRKPLPLILTLTIVLPFVLVQSTLACPFCAAVSQTFSEEINTMDAVVIAKLVEPPKETDSSDEISKAKFQIEKIIKGESHIGQMHEIESLYFGEAKNGQSFLIMGVDPPKLMWSTPLQLSDRAKTYVTKLLDVPKEGAERLAFFQEYLEDHDEMLARDAYDEFAKAPYDEIKALKEKIDYAKLIEWIKSEDVPASRRRLYLTMLGVRGSEMDLPMLELMMKSKDRKEKAGLDAMIGCYLTLKGEKGLSLIEDLFLKNKKAEYADTYAAIMALRFHATDGGIIDREQVVESLRYMLDRPQLADLVIPDLARWEDWSVMGQLVKLFKEADEKSSWVRVPVVNYLRACPLPESKDLIKELEKIDPAAVKRAHTFFPVTPSSGEEKSSNWQRPKKDRVVAKIAPATNFVPPAVEDGDEVAVAESLAVNQASRPVTPVVLANKPPNSFLIPGVAILSAIAIMSLLWAILRGTNGRVSA